MIYKYSCRSMRLLYLPEPGMLEHSTTQHGSGNISNHEVKTLDNVQCVAPIMPCSQKPIANKHKHMNFTHISSRDTIK